MVSPAILGRVNIGNCSTVTATGTAKPRTMRSRGRRERRRNSRQPSAAAQASKAASPTLEGPTSMYTAHPPHFINDATLNRCGSSGSAPGAAQDQGCGHGEERPQG